MMKSWIYIDKLKVHAFHGVMPQERVVGNDYEVSLKVGCSIDKAMLSDDVNDTINYASLAQLVKDEMAIESSLLEHVAGRILSKLRTEYKEITNIRLSITKIAPPIVADIRGAGVEIEWEV